MIKALTTAATGMQAQETRLDVTSNNIANVSTAGFKRGRAEFEDLMYQNLRAAGAETGPDTRLPTGVQVGSGTRIVATQRDHSEGDLSQTNNPLDLAIEGSGFFEVQQPSGELAYTRAGSLKLDAEGKVVTAEGYPLSQAITVPPDAQSVTVAADGTVSATVPNSTTPVELGKIEITTFVNPAGLTATGHNLYLPTAASELAGHGRRRHRRRRHAHPGPARAVERERGDRDDRSHRRPARLRGELAGDQGGRRDARSDRAAAMRKARIHRARDPRRADRDPRRPRTQDARRAPRRRDRPRRRRLAPGRPRRVVRVIAPAREIADGATPVRESGTTRPGPAWPAWRSRRPGSSANASAGPSSRVWARVELAEVRSVLVAARRLTAGERLDVDDVVVEARAARGLAL